MTHPYPMYASLLYANEAYTIHRTATIEHSVLAVVPEANFSRASSDANATFDILQPACNHDNQPSQQQSRPGSWHMHRPLDIVNFSGTKSFDQVGVYLCTLRAYAQIRQVHHRES